MTAKTYPRPAQPPRVPNGHGYCWAAGPNGARCTHPKGHPGRHLDPYTPRTAW